MADGGQFVLAERALVMAVMVSVPKGRMWRLIALAVRRVPLVRRSLQRLGRADCLAGAACWWSGTAA